MNKNQISKNKVIKLIYDNYENDIHNFTETLKKAMMIDCDTRKKNAEMARKALDKLRPEKIKKDWIQLFVEVSD